VREVFLTDEYGYSRKTGAYTISHKGTDYRAKIGDDVMAISDGKVVLAEEFPTYGKSVVVDHGYGLQSLYMHLSEIRVRVGEDVVKGQVIASSGESGYAEFPHLHLSVRINGTSIDPYFFIETMQKFNEEDII
jgi:murein DD-endopeptidase MepM/ murein hydrolase activator NlpD